MLKVIYFGCYCFLPHISKCYWNWTLSLLQHKLKPCFHGHYVMVKSNYPICQILKKTNLAGRMVSWSITLSEYDIHLAPKRSIKSHVLIDFLTKFSSPVGDEVHHMWIISVDGASNLKRIGAWGDDTFLVLREVHQGTC